jgi:hypothetical protein
MVQTQNVKITKESLTDFQLTEIANELKKIKLSSNKFNESKYSRAPQQQQLTSIIPLSGLDSFSETSRKILEKAKIPQIDEAVLVGEYSENQIRFPLYDTSKISTHPDLTINFILKINSYTKTSSSAGNRYKLFTSPKIYEFLLDANNRNIPYPALSKLVDVVEIDLKPLINQVIKQRKDEIPINVKINNNLGIKYNPSRKDYDIDYDILLSYINWIVSKPSTNYEERVLPVSDISDVVIELDLDADESEETNESSDTTTTTNQNPSYEPVGRAGNTIGETVTVDGMKFEWNGTSWEPATLEMPSGGTTPQGGSGNQTNNQGGSTNQEYLGGFS